jgi:hypothetical protein
MCLEGPEDEGPVMLAKAALAMGLTRTVRDFAKVTIGLHSGILSVLQFFVCDPVLQGSAKRTIPDIDLAAKKFLDGFRSGAFGRVNLDCEVTARVRVAVEGRQEETKRIVTARRGGSRSRN